MYDLSYYIDQYIGNEVNVISKLGGKNACKKNSFKKD